MRKEFKLTDKELEKLLDACKPVTYMVFGGYAPPAPQENANRAWRQLGDKLGFDSMSVESASGKSERFFTAILKEPKESHDESK